MAAARAIAAGIAVMPAAAALFGLAGIGGAAEQAV
jgi:hypothetical protein